MKNTWFCLLLIAAPALLCAFCASSNPATQGGAASTKTLPSKAARASAYTAEDVSLEEAFDRGHWVTRPVRDAITIIGITGRRGSRGEAVKEALADAARKAALYHGVYAESAAALNQGGGNLDYFSGFDYQISPSNSYEAYIDALIFDEDEDVLEKNGVIIVRARYFGDFDVPPYEPAAAENGKPIWVQNYTAADIPGFLTGVGHSSNKGTLQRTHTASYETALVSILPARVSSEVIDVDGSKLTSSVTKSEGYLSNVMILETWLDKKTNSVWTLVAAKPADAP
jgi:hypothetical protein